jgi:peptidoglycan/LPS O-acetylase OafA/YrhL
MGCPVENSVTSGAARRPFHANLEALRGIAALLVVLHHLSLNAGSLLASVPILRQGWLFVDLFFVLSGYVIAAVHAESDATPAAARRFLIRRFFRLYPLHFATLLAALAIDFHNGTARLPGYAIMAGMNLTMTHSWGLVPGSVLNGPSWSISTEWAAYLLFAWICLATPLVRRRLLIIGGVGLLSFAALLVWRGGGLEGDLLFRLPRCLLSFALGAGVWAWCRGRPPLVRRSAAALQLLAGGAMAAMLAAAGLAPQLTLLMPVISAAMIAAMVRDPGSAVRRTLERPIPQWLGRCSYSLYLVHMPLFRALLLATPGGWPDDPLAANLWVATALCLLFVAATLTQRWIERPWREFGRRLADAPAPVPATRAAA